MFTRSEYAQDALFPSCSRSPIPSSSSTAIISFTPSSSSLPTTPNHRTSRTPLPPHFPVAPSPSLLSPSSSKASLAPALSLNKERYRPPSPALSPPDQQRKTLRSSPPNRHLFFPVRASLAVHTRPARPSVLMSELASCPGSPVRRSRALSPSRPEHGTRPPSRCESLLRDTLRRADEQDRSFVHRTASRSPSRFAGRRSRPRGNSFLKREECADSDCEFDDNVFFPTKDERDAFNYHTRAQAMAMRGRGAMSASSTDAASPPYPYGSPSSPSPMPPSMLRTRTAPSVPRVKAHTYDDEPRSIFTRPPPSPQKGRRSLPDSVPQSHASVSPSNDCSPKQRQSALSPHESVLRAKLEYVLQKADESGTPPMSMGRLQRNHHRTFSHGVNITTSPKHRDDPSPTSPSPRSLAPSSLSNSATDLARVNSVPLRRDSRTYRTSPSSPSEPLTPPPTPPFNARTASEVCKRMNGYVSFASVEGLGEPPGLEIDGEESEDGLRKWGRWLRVLPFISHVSTEHEAGQLAMNRHRQETSAS